MLVTRKKVDDPFAQSLYLLKDTNAVLVIRNQFFQGVGWGTLMVYLWVVVVNVGGCIIYGTLL